MRRKSKWIDGLESLVPVYSWVTEDGQLKNLLLAKLKLSRVDFSATQLAATTLINSKAKLARAYHLFRRLYGNSIRWLYADTDSLVVSTSNRDWLQLEDDSLDFTERAALRKELFGEFLPAFCYSTNPELVRGSARFAARGSKTGFLKLEEDNIKSAIFLGIKCYMLCTEDRTICKFKALSSGREQLREADYIDLIKTEIERRPKNLLERRTELRIRDGISVMETTRLSTTYRSRLQYKMKTLDGPNEMVSFE